MRPLLTLVGALLLLLMRPAGATAALVAAPDEGPILAGRNCGGTSKPGSLSQAGLAAEGGPGWTLGGALDKPAGIGNQLAPSIAVSPAGGVYYAWQEQRTGDFGDILAAPLAGELGAGRRAVRVDDTGVATVEQASPALAIDGAGRIHAVWEDLRGGALRRLYYAASTDGGATWGQPQRVDNGIGNAFTNPQVAVDATGGVHCIWCQLTVNVNAAIVAARSIDHGASWGDRATLASTTGTAEPLALAADEVGNIFAAWSDDSAGTTALHTAQWSGERLYLPLLRR
jgi:hypothetical protein